MKSYIKIYILSIILIGILCLVFTGVELWMGRQRNILPWCSSTILICYLTSTTHIIAREIYKEYRNKKSKVEISNNSIALVFLISMFIQIVGTFFICFEAWRGFGSIHAIEYFTGAIFLLLSVYFFKQASYKLINKENKDEKNKTE